MLSWRNSAARRQWWTTHHMLAPTTCILKPPATKYCICLISETTWSRTRCVPLSRLFIMKWTFTLWNSRLFDKGAHCVGKVLPVLAMCTFRSERTAKYDDDPEQFSFHFVTFMPDIRRWELEMVRQISRVRLYPVWIPPWKANDRGVIRESRTTRPLTNTDASMRPTIRHSHRSHPYSPMGMLLAGLFCDVRL